MEKKHSPKSKAFPPDWKDPTHYPDPKTTTGTQWAWEFLRRSPGYLELFEKYPGAGWMSRISEENDGWGKDVLQDIVRGDKDPLSFGRVVTYIDYGGTLVSPEESQPPNGIFDNPEGLTLVSQKGDKVVFEFSIMDSITKLITGREGPGFEYTFTDWIDGQVYRAGEYLKAQRKIKDNPSLEIHCATFKKRVRNRMIDGEKLVAYLRILDAKQAKPLPPASKIVEVFPSRNTDFRQQVSDAYKAAKKLRDHDNSLLAQQYQFQNRTVKDKKPPA